MDSAMADDLSRELETYQRHLPELAAAAGKYALVKGDKLIGTFASYEDALKVGYDSFGLTPFLVKRVNVAESISFFTRDVAACPT